MCSGILPSPAPFRTFSGEHILILAGLVLAGALIVWISKRGSPRTRAWLGRFLGLLLLGYGLAIYAQLYLDGQLHWSYSLPLELCHWVLIACIISCFRPTPITSEIAYFWGFAGTLQAAITPEIGTGFPSWECVQFYWSHGAILLAIVYFVAGQEFRPRKGSVLRMLVAVNLWAASVGTIDWIFGWNYGYLCAKPSQPSLLDYMGPWPWYLLTGEVIAVVSFSLLALPWRFLRGGVGRPEGEGGQ